jgi:hypothetical protein
MPRMSSPIILKRDLTTFNYLANKRSRKIEFNPKNHQNKL